MAGEDAAAAAAAAGVAAVKKPLKEEEEEDDDELDNVPLALSRPKKAGNATASKVKKEEDDDDEEDDLPISHSRAKKGNDKQKGTMNSNTKASKSKKEADSDYDDFMPISHKKKVGAGASNAKASKVKKLKDEDLEDLKEDKKRKKRGGVKEEAIVPVKGDKVKKEKKVYELPGQKHDPPAERDPLRIFYESLYEQVPTSEMAAIWLMEWGLLPLDVARKVYEKKQGQKFKSPVKTIVSKRKPTPTKKTPASSAMKSVSATKSTGKPTSQKKRKASGESEDDEDGDFVVPKAKTKRQKASS